MTQFDHAAPEFLIIDDFLPDPSAIRERALRCNYQKSCHLAGLRSMENIMTPELHARIESLTAKKFRTVNSFFQYSTEADADSRYIHADLSDWAGVIYLVHEKPGEPGTSLYRHRSSSVTRYGRNNPEVIRAALNRRVSTERILLELHQDRSSFECWDKIVTVPIKFNRLFLYNASQFHCNESAWGTDLASSRLVQSVFAHES